MKKFFCAVLVCLFAWPAQAEEIILKKVPFITQSPPGDWQDNKNCGPTSALMVAGYYQAEDPSEEKLQAVIDWLYGQGYIAPQPEAEYYDGNATTAMQVGNILSGHFQLGPVAKKNEKDIAFVKDKLSKGNPLIVAVNIDMNPDKAGHFMVVVGIKDDAVIVHDPGKTGGALNEYPLDQFMASWQTSNYASVFVDTSNVAWHPDGTLVRVTGDEKIYLVDGGETHLIASDAVFKAHGFDWQKIIFVSQKEFECFSAGAKIDWQPYRELFRVGDVYYLMEKNAFNAAACAVYEFSSAFSFNSWNIAGEVGEPDESTANAKYFSSCADDGILFVRAGTLVKPLFAVPGYGAGVVFVASGNGLLLPFANWPTFVAMGYDKLPLTLIAENDFAGSFFSFGEMITEATSEQCLTGVSFGDVDPAPLEADGDGDGFSMTKGDCNDNDPSIFPNGVEVCDYVDNDCDGAVDENVVNACGGCGFAPIEVCDGADNDCDGAVDEGELCGNGFVCSAGGCLVVVTEPAPEEQPEQPAEDPPDEPKQFTPWSDEVTCVVTCPPGMKAYVWYASDGQVSGQSATMNSSVAEICLRGQAWIDYNCACLAPQEWSCFDPNAAEIYCNHQFDLKNPGVIDAKGEGEVWFTDFQCFPD